MALKKPSSSKKMGKKKKQETTGNGNSRLGKIAENQFSYDTKEFENRDFLSTVELLDTKAILNNVKGQPIALENGYSGYLQIMEVRGKDLNSLSDNERQRTIQNFRKWNSEITFDYMFESTTLPTDTSEQIIESRRILNEVRREMSKTGISENRMEQLKDRESILMQNILSEEAVEQELYNAESGFTETLLKTCIGRCVRPRLAEMGILFQLLFRLAKKSRFSSSTIIKMKRCSRDVFKETKS